MLEIHKADASLSDAKFQRELNLETGIIDQSMGGLTKAQCVRYTGLYLDIMTDILMVFVLLLFVIVLIVIGHNISTEIEIGYVNLGILKAQGFTDKKIAALLMLQYVLAELIGIVLGFVLSYPLERSISDIFMDITAILPSHAVAAAQSALFLALILSASLLLSWSSTRRLAKISPVKAISGGREEIYFDSRFHAPVSKRALSLSLAFRSFTSAKRRYVGILFISALLTFFALTVNIVGDIVKSRSALEMMGMEYTDLDIHFMDREAREHVQDFEEIIESYSEITKKYYMCSAYLSLNGENLQCSGYQYPEYISGMLKGRQPLYDNEIVITEMVADTLELSMGDEVVVTFEDRQATYLISGIYQSTHDAGMCFAMSQEGTKRLSTVSISFMGVALADTSQSKRIAQELTEKYGDIIEAESYDSSATSYLDEMFDDSILAMQAVIYSFSTIFALITVIMVCSKAFIQERRDIGIYKAIGFRSGKLRRQFSLRYFIVSLIGGAVGVVLSMLLSVKALNMIFSLFGITHVAARFSAGSIAVAILFVSGCVLIFSFAASRKVKKVDVRELITE
ncbi:MAG: ABC transporter permease [Lachnospiraceae bacterium]|nr:ABC transporter permease [Lachnospiraceae bacterium]